MEDDVPASPYDSADVPAGDYLEASVEMLLV
jgi:hypothetical protein